MPCNKNFAPDDFVHTQRESEDVIYVTLLRKMQTHEFKGVWTRPAQMSPRKEFLNMIQNCVKQKQSIL